MGAYHILVVDDDRGAARLIGMLLERQGYRVSVVYSGGAALDAAQADPPDLIILDVMMPHMDGYAVARQLRALPTTAHIPIIMFTAKGLADDKAEGFEAGVDDYLTKPVRPAELAARVKAALARGTSGVSPAPEDCALADAPLRSLIEQAADLLRSARYAVALTGAGISTPSGIPDFRSPRSGLWEQVDPLEVASIYGFRRNPERFFAWIRPLARLIAEAEPNAAHLALAQLEQMGILKALITQNIDTLHLRAGSQVVYEIHGDMREATCVECFRTYPTAPFLEHFIATGQVPRCQHCGGVLKPNVILFGEALPVEAMQAAQRAARECDVMLVAGSSLAVAPASDLPLVALAHGAHLIIINYEPTFVDDEAAVVIHDDVAHVLPCLVRLLEDKQR